VLLNLSPQNYVGNFFPLQPLLLPSPANKNEEGHHWLNVHCKFGRLSKADPHSIDK